jgi:hypothetical protein
MLLEHLLSFIHHSKLSFRLQLGLTFQDIYNMLRVFSLQFSYIIPVLLSIAHLQKLHKVSRLQVASTHFTLVSCRHKHLKLVHHGNQKAILQSTHFDTNTVCHRELLS